MHQCIHFKFFCNHILTNIFMCSFELWLLVVECRNDFHFSQALFESSAGLQNRLGINLFKVGFAPSCESGEQSIFHLPMCPIFC